MVKNFRNLKRDFGGTKWAFPEICLEWMKKGYFLINALIVEEI